MSLQTLVHGLRVDRLHLRREIVGERLQARTVEAVADPGSGSMRGLEAIIALTAIATAILIGLGR